MTGKRDREIVRLQSNPDLRRLYLREALLICDNGTESSTCAHYQHNFPTFEKCK